jgi:hypothetical protein
MASVAMYGSESARSSAPASTSSGGTPWLKSTILLSGAIRLMTQWQIPTHSFR